MRYLYALALLLLVSHSICFSQSVTIHGQVKTIDSVALASVSVVLKGAAISTSTNAEGRFSISVPKLPAILVFSYIAYETKELVVAKKDSAAYLSIHLEPATVSLSEVVVVGYGTSRKREIIGSSSVIRGKVAGVRTGKKDVVPTTRATGSFSKIAEDGKQASIGRPSGGRSKVLTAGELSDFKKWKLWEGYSTAEFRVWSEHWGIRPVNRYCLQVQNSAGKAITGENAWLVNLSTNDTIWRAVTDNTGKAELWANIETVKQGHTNYAIVCGGQTHRNPNVFENGINRITINKKCAPSNTADIAFVVDATGSMGDEIKYLQEELQDVIANVASRNKGMDLRTGSVFYRDRGDNYVTRVQDFQSDASALIGFIKNQSADGGGDVPEAVEEALHTALNDMHWDKDATAKILFLILDAPPHDHAGEKMKTLMVQAAAMGVRIVPVVCSGIDKSTEYLMRALALATNGSYVFLTDDSGVGDAHIKPTTDNFKVELLNDLLQRIIAEMIYTAPCSDQATIVSGPVNTENDVAKITAFPNPTAGRIEIRCTQKIKELFITDFAGKILEKINTGGRSQNWQTDLGRYPSGTYLISYFIEDKGWGVKRVMVVK